MSWKIELTRESKKKLGKLDRASAKRIRDYLRRQVEPASGPRGLAKPLKGRLQCSGVFAQEAIA